jgi:hypothetical protein
MIAGLVEHTSCRVCRNELLPALDLGVQHLPAFPETTDGIPRLESAPLVLARCTHADCSLVQLVHTVPAEKLFREYWYRSGTNESMVAALGDVVWKAREKCPVGKDHAVMDIGANDGTLLGFYDDPQPLRIAVEPAKNVETQNCDLRIEEFFPFKTVLRPATPIRIITAIAMFYDLEDPDAFVDGISDWLHPDGLFVLQVGYLLNMLSSNAFDAVCHEHVEYYSLKSIVHLLARHGLMVEDIELNEVNGGSLRCYVRHAAVANPTPAVSRQLNIETLAALDSPLPLANFKQRVKRIAAGIFEAVQNENDASLPVDVYGASTKGLTLMQTVGLDATMIRWAADRNPEKWGRVYGSTMIPIVDETLWRERPVGLALVLPWHFREGILEREKAWREAGGRFLFPLPEMEVV